VLPNGYISKHSAPYWSNPPFLIFDIWAPWCPALSTGVLEDYGAHKVNTYSIQQMQVKNTNRTFQPIANNLVTVQKPLLLSLLKSQLQHKLSP